MTRALVLLSALLLACEAPVAEEVAPDCAAMAAAHSKLMTGCFSARRQFQATVNERPHLREAARVEYAGGEVSIEVIEKEVLKKGFALDSEDGDMAASVPFRCDRLSQLSSDRYRLESTEEPEHVEFDYDASRGVLLPQRWVFESTERFLLKKFHIRAEAVYTDVSFDNCAPAAVEQ